MMQSCSVVIYEYQSTAFFYVALVIRLLTVWIHLLSSVQGSQKKHTGKKASGSSYPNFEVLDIF